MVRVAVAGASGYIGAELLRLLLQHPEVTVTAVTSERLAGEALSATYPHLRGLTGLRFQEIDAARLAREIDVVFLALPHMESQQVVPVLRRQGVKVIDLSADYRLSDPAVYEQWYGHVHTDPTRLGSTVYGLPELFADRIPGRNLIANPGCYTSTSILALAPLLRGRHIEPAGIIIDGKSGVSGAGRTPKQNILYSECNESFAAYSVGNHRHTPEIEQVLSEVAGTSVQVIFTPHLTPMDRGIFATIYATPTAQASSGCLSAAKAAGRKRKLANATSAPIAKVMAASWKGPRGAAGRGASSMGRSRRGPLMTATFGATIRSSWSATKSPNEGL